MECFLIQHVNEGVALPGNGISGIAFPQERNQQLNGRQARQALLCVGYAVSGCHRRKPGVELHTLKRRRHHQEPVFCIELIEFAFDDALDRNGECVTDLID